MNPSEIAIVRRESEATVTWAAAQESSEIQAIGRSASLVLDLPAAFTGTSLTYERKLADGSWSPVHINGTAVTDVVAGSTKSSNILSANLFGLGTFRIKSSASETCTATLRIGG